MQDGLLELRGMEVQVLEIPGFTIIMPRDTPVTQDPIWKGSRPMHTLLSMVFSSSLLSSPSLLRGDPGWMLRKKVGLCCPKRIGRRGGLLLVRNLRPGVRVLAGRRGLVVLDLLLIDPIPGIGRAAGSRVGLGADGGCLL